ncbi:MAG: ABC transporter ATP-binding protein [Candidatus Obscuribacterales bacterium]|nr:ABC transporter ATP-binding protein [Candidatus Obscuribacterales bacterium]
MNRPAVEAVNISKSFGNLQVVKPLDLSIGSGEFFSLLGPSGCGKTTLLRMIAGFETPTTGCVLVSDQDMTKVPPHKRPVNMVFQSYALFPHLTIAENVAFGLKAAGEAAGNIAGKVKEALQLVHLGDYGERYPSQLSGGQQQRVALARAVVKRPQVLLLDEPLSALDLKIRHQMQEELSRLQRELGITFIMVTHDQGEALALSTRVAVFYQGNLEQVGTPEEIYEQPKTAFVASFIGQTNLLDGQVVERQTSHIRVKIADNVFLWVRDLLEGGPSKIGDPVYVVLRTQVPKVVPLAKAPAADANTNCLTATIDQKSYQGHVTDYWLKLDCGITLRTSVNTSAESNFQLDDEVAVVIEADSAYVLADGAAHPRPKELAVV